MELTVFNDSDFPVDFSYFILYIIISGEVSEKSDGDVKDISIEDRSFGATSSSMSTASSSFTSSSSSSSFSSPSSDSSSFSSLSFDDISSKRRAVSRAKGQNRDRGKEYGRNKVTTSIKSELRDGNEEDTSVTTGIDKDSLEGSEHESINTSFGKIETLRTERSLDRSVRETSGVQESKLRGRGARSADGVVSRTSGQRNCKPERKGVNGVRGLEKVGPKNAVTNSFTARDPYLKESNSRSSASIETTSSKGDESKVSPQAGNNSFILGQKCVACDFVSSQGSEMIEHG